MQDAAEEEVDYEADEVDEVATAPEEPAPHEARRPRPESESKSAAEVRLRTQNPRIYKCAETGRMQMTRSTSGTVVDIA